MLKEEPNIVQKSSVKYQYLATIVVNICVIGYGANSGWCSPSFILLTSDDSPLPTGKISMEEASWIASMLCIGGLFGNIIFGFLTKAFGRKLPLILITIPAIIGWLLILYAQNVYYLYVSRFMSGFIGGGLFLVVPLYLNEIASDSVRGVLGSSIMLSYNSGMLLAFVLGNYCEYETTPKVVVGMTVVCLVLLFRMPETPIFLLQKSKISETEKSIRFYQNRRGNPNDYEFIQTEIEKLKRSISGTKTDGASESSFSWSDLFSKPGRNAMTIGLVLATVNQMCGCFAMLNYTANIFKEAGSSLSPNMSAIVVGIIQLIGSYSATFLVDRLSGRKFLFVCSTVGTALGLIVLGGYVFLKQSGVNVQPFVFASFSFVIFIASWAILTLVFLVISEVMPQKLKEFGTTFCMMFLWISAFLAVKLLPFMNEKLSFHGTMFFFAGCCLLTAVFIIFKMPETKGRSYEEIMNILSK